MSRARNGYARHQELRETQQLDFALDQALGWKRRHLAGVVMGVFEDSETARIYRIQKAGGDRTNHGFHAGGQGMPVTGPRAFDFAGTERHHFADAAFEGTGKTGVPLDPIDQEDAVTLPGVFTGERFDTLGGPAERNDIETAYDRASHRHLVDAVMGQHHRLARSRGGTVASHGWKVIFLRRKWSARCEVSPLPRPAELHENRDAFAKESKRASARASPQTA